MEPDVAALLSSTVFRYFPDQTVLSVWENSHVHINTTESWVGYGGRGREGSSTFSSTLLLLVTMLPGELLCCSVSAAPGTRFAATFGVFSGEIRLLGDRWCGMQV